MRYLNRLDTVTLLLMFINILAFMYEVFKLGFSLLIPSVVANVDFASIGGLNSHTPIYSYITSMFLHGSIIHIFFNMTALMSIGLLIHHEFGSIVYIIGYFLSGIGANILSVIVMPETTTVGASGAIFGLFGMYVAYSMFKGFGMFKNAFVGLGFSIASGIFIPNVNIWAHLGGAIIGLVFGMIIMIIRKTGTGIKRGLSKKKNKRPSEAEEWSNQINYY